VELIIKAGLLADTQLIEAKKKESYGGNAPKTPKGNCCLK
jgi:hypothetical protein